MRKVFLNNDRIQLAYFVGMISENKVAIETLKGELISYDIDKVTMIELDERPVQNPHEKEIDKFYFLQKDIFCSLISKGENIEYSENEINDIYNKSKELTTIFLTKFKKTKYEL